MEVFFDARPSNLIARDPLRLVVENISQLFELFPLGNFGQDLGRNDDEAAHPKQSAANSELPRPENRVIGCRSGDDATDKGRATRGSTWSDGRAGRNGSRGDRQRGKRRQPLGSSQPIRSQQQRRLLLRRQATRVEDR